MKLQVLNVVAPFLTLLFQSSFTLVLCAEEAVSKTHNTYKREALRPLFKQATVEFKEGSEISE